MNKLYLINEKMIGSAFELSKNGKIIIFSKSWKLDLGYEYETITCATLAKLYLEKTSLKVGSNNWKKANEIQSKLFEDAEIYLIYDDVIEKNLCLENKILYIIEKNDEINNYDAQKIFFMNPWPIFFEYIKSKYNNYEIELVSKNEEDLLAFHYAF